MLLPQRSGRQAFSWRMSRLIARTAIPLAARNFVRTANRRLGWVSDRGGTSSDLPTREGARAVQLEPAPACATPAR
jgi:hypothetical protein